ncbi:MAG TPA: SCO family protein [Flavobacteriia bacterium]|nr:SCO family protein [Flavobacteriia bacterium]
MKNKSYIGISFIVLLFGIYAIPKIIDRVKNGTVVKMDKRTDKIQVPISKGTPSDLVKFEKVPDFSFTDQNQKRITNKDYLGKVYVVEFFFTSCPGICPKMNKNMVIVQNEYKNNPLFAIASVSVDPKRDTPKRLKEYAQEKGATMQNWHFLTGDIDKVMNLSNKGFKLHAEENPEAEGGFEHSGLFALIDKKGYIRSRKVKTGEFENPIKFYNGLDSVQVKWLIDDIQKLIKE